MAQKQRIYIVIDADGIGQAYSNLTKAAYNMHKASYHTLYKKLQRSEIVNYKGYTIYKVILK